MEKKLEDFDAEERQEMAELLTILSQYCTNAANKLFSAALAIQGDGFSDNARKAADMRYRARKAAEYAERLTRLEEQSSTFEVSDKCDRCGAPGTVLWLSRDPSDRLAEVLCQNCAGPVPRKGAG